MELVHGAGKTSKLAREDVISTMPYLVITDILNRLPLKEAARTSIVSREWRRKWTMLTQLVFNGDFNEYLEETRNEQNSMKIINGILRHLKGPITKFTLHVEEEGYSIELLEDINRRVMFLSNNGIKELTFVKYGEIIELPTQFFSCLELKHLKLYNCHFRPMSGFRGFPNLLSLELNEVKFENYKCGEFLTRCPLLEILNVWYNIGSEIKEVEIAQLENLKELSLTLSELHNWERITRSGIFQLIGCFPKLHELRLFFDDCKFSADTVKRVSTSFPCLKTLTLGHVDLSCDIMVTSAIELICCSPNLQTLTIRPAYKAANSPPAVCPSKVNLSGMVQLQLQRVILRGSNCSEVEVHLIKYILACSPMLKKIDIIAANSSQVFGGDNGKLMFVTKLLKLQRAFPRAEIDFHGV
ncbi:putative F-box-like domain superfamily protein [Tanacetum coccineum]